MRQPKPMIGQLSFPKQKSENCLTLWASNRPQNPQIKDKAFSQINNSQELPRLDSINDFQMNFDNVD